MEAKPSSQSIIHAILASILELPAADADSHVDENSQGEWQDLSKEGSDYITAPDMR